jgi:twitching motility protein PilT
VFDLDAALRYLVVNEGSDLHLKVPSRPIVRVHGSMEPIDGSEPLRPEDTENVVRRMLGDPQKISEFEAENEVDFSYAVQGLGRFRVNAFRQRGSVSLVMRAIPVNIKTIDELDLPPVLKTLAEKERGIILLTGTTGSGKSTTLAAIIDHINRHQRKHIVTIEDPIEFLHRDKGSIINQREVGMDTASFKRALRRVLRQDPDVILVGEMRDEETVQTALSAAETGHLVLSTLHTVDAPETINRIIDFFPPHQHQQARAMIAGTLQGIISQRLVKTKDGQGRVACCEIMLKTGRVRDMILDSKQTGSLQQVVAEGEYYGMQTFDQALLKHLRAGRISVDEAMRSASSPHDFKLMVAAEAREGTIHMDETPTPQAPAPKAPPMTVDLAPALAARPAPPMAPAGSRPAAPPVAPPVAAPVAPPARPAAPPVGRPVSPPPAPARPAAPVGAPPSAPPPFSSAPPPGVRR